jgi:anti-anti-sigma factor
MDLQIDTKCADGVMWVRVAGEIDIGNAAHLQASLDQTTATNPARAVHVDLAEVTFLDAAGLTALLKAQRQAHRVGSAFLVCNATGIVREVFDVTGLTAQFGLDDCHR